MSLYDDLQRARDLLAAQQYQPNPWDRLAAEALNSAERTGRVKALREAGNWLAGMAQVSVNLDTEMVERAYLHASDELHRWADETERGEVLP